MRLHNITNVLMAHVEDGYFVNVHNHVPVDGYMVGGEVESLVIDESKNHQPYLTTDRYIANHWDLLARGDYFAGVRTDSETELIHVDIRRNVADLYAALAIASARGELAIWDVASAKEVRTEIEPSRF
jgi:hypothetical protein